MSELNRTEAELTTADVAAATAKPVIVSQSRNRIAAEDVDEREQDRPVEIGNRTTGKRDWENSTTKDQVQNAVTSAPLFSESDIGDLRARWSNVQAEFVDEPRRAVEKADELVATVMHRLAEGFATERGSLEKQWESGGSASTEDLRVALQRYRAFFNRLLNAA
jgi:hypothetical protein